MNQRELKDWALNFFFCWWIYDNVVNVLSLSTAENFIILTRHGYGKQITLRHRIRIQGKAALFAFN